MTTDLGITVGFKFELGQPIC